MTTRIIIGLLCLILTGLGVVIYQNYQKVQRARAEAAEGAVLNQFTDGPRFTAEPHVPPTTPQFRQRPTNRIPTAPQPGAPAVPVFPQPGEVEQANGPSLHERAPFVAPVPSVALLSGSAASGVEISGHVTLLGNPPPEKVIDMSGPFAVCGRQLNQPATTHHYVVSPEGGFANVFVYIKQGLENRSFQIPAASPVLSNSNCFFEPYVFGVQTGQLFTIFNADPMAHNVRALPRVPGNDAFSFVQVIRGQTTKKKFAKSEVLVKLQCDVHPWMFAYVGVVAHPFYTVTDKEGNFKLPAGLSPGTYTLSAVHPKAGELTQEISVGDGESKALNFNFSVPPSPLKIASGKAYAEQ